MFNNKIKVTDLEGIKALSIHPETDVSHCMINIESTGELERKVLKPDDVPENSIPRFFKGTKVHLLSLDGEKELYSIPIPDKTTDGKTPEEFFMYQGAVQRLVERGWKLLDSWTEKIKFGIFVGIIFAEIIVLFLIFFGVSGNA
jgi:hypothetical protein